MQRLALYAGDSRAISPFFKEEVIGYCVLYLVEVLNPLSPNSDQQQFSPNNIHTMSRD